MQQPSKRQPSEVEARLCRKCQAVHTFVSPIEFELYKEENDIDEEQVATVSCNQFGRNHKSRRFQLRKASGEEQISVSEITLEDASMVSLISEFTVSFLITELAMFLLIMDSKVRHGHATCSGTPL